MNTQLPNRPEIGPGRLLIGGKWRDGERGESYPTINPATEEPATTIAMGTLADLDEAIRAARAAFDEGPWPRMEGVERGKVLNRVAELIEAELESLAIRQVVEMGKNIRQSRLEVQGVAELFRYHAGWASKLDGAVRQVPGGFHCYVTLEPVGVVAAITPFNVPLYLTATKAAPALAAGNVFIHKPSDTASISALRMAELIQEAGVPDGVYSVVTGNGRELGQAISAHRGIDKIAFTGSTRTGIDIIQRSAPTVKKVTMELGGKSPHIICADADLDKAAQMALVGNFLNSGQICTSGSRLIVERPIYAEMLDRLKAILESLKIGDPHDASTFFGPIASKKQYDQVVGYMDTGRADGARLVTGGAKASGPNGKGYFVQPTVFADARNDMRIAREEIFGPVLTVIPVDSVDEAIRVGNDTEYGLACAVQTRSMENAFKVARGIKAGTVWVNTEYQWQAMAPYGGFKTSGFGRESGREAYESYTEAKTVWIETGAAPAA